MHLAIGLEYISGYTHIESLIIQSLPDTTVLIPV